MTPPTDSSAHEPDGSCVHPEPGGGRQEDRTVEGVPPEVLEAAMAAFDSWDPEVATADLVYDSNVEGDRRFTRHDNTRVLRFGPAEWGVSVEVRPDGELLELAFDLRPAASVAFLVHHDGGPTRVQGDTTGHGHLGAVPSGLVSVELEVTELSGVRRVQTAWIRV